MIRERLQIIGQALRNRQIPEVAVEKTANNILGGFLDFGQTKLSTDKTVSIKLLEANKEWVYRNNDVIAKSVAAIEFILFKVKTVNGEFEFEKIEQNRLLDLLDRFNESTSKDDGIYITQSHKKLSGDAFWLIQRDRTGTPTDIYTLEPDKIELKLGDFTKSGSALIEAYEYKVVVDGKTKKIVYKPQDIIHFKNPNPTNPFRGYGAVEAAAETIDLDVLTNALSRQLFENGAITNFMLTTDKSITDEQLKRIKAEFRAAHGGVRNAFKTIVMGGGLTPKELRMSNKDMEFQAQLEWYRDKIMIIFGNTKASLGIIDDVNRASHESSINAWKESTVKPDMASICNTLNEFLVPQFGDDLILGFADPVPDNREAKLEEAKVLKEAGVASRNEIRALLGYETLDGEEHDAVPIAGEVPAPLQNVDVKRALRKRGMYAKLDSHREIYKASKKAAKEIITKRKKATQNKHSDVTAREHAVLSNDDVWNYWEKQIRMVEKLEDRFRNKVEQFIGKVKEDVLANYPEKQPKQYKKKLFDTEEYVVQAGFDFTPLLTEAATLAGVQALSLIDYDGTYIMDIEQVIANNIKLFTRSMLDTEQKKMTQIIADGLKEGKSIPQIRTLMSDAFDNLSKVQSERITRTEVLKAANQGAVDAWEQSGVVEAKQWLTAEDDRVDPACAALNGKIIGLDKNFFDKGSEFMGIKLDYADVDEPPLHPNCRCTPLPVLVGEKGADAVSATNAKLEEENKQLRQFIKELGDDA